jgi:hypothetical protein
MLAKQQNTDMHQPSHQSRSAWELADIYRRYGLQYLQQNRLPSDHQKTIRDIVLCRTAYLGGHVEQCDTCGRRQTLYNSCRNRHCPKCQALPKARWLKARRAELLPTAYYHLVFTLPHAINPIARCNQRLIYSLLFKAAAQTLLAFGQKQLGGKLGFSGILHTWDQKLNYHVHLHCVVAGGVLSADAKRWIPAGENYLFCVKALSRVFRGKFIDYLQQAYHSDKLVLAGQAKLWQSRQKFHNLCNKLWSKHWVVYAKEPFGGPQKVLDYLGRYTHRVAISNDRIVNAENGEVTFTYRDRNDDHRLKQASLSADEFMRRFLLHVVPQNFMRIRHFGFLANRYKKQLLGTCRHLLGLPADIAETVSKDTRQLMLEITGIDIDICPFCRKGRMQRIEKLPEFQTVSLIALLN